jgi:hypothetical protein
MRLRLQGWKRVADERLQYELTLGSMAGAKPPISVYWREARRESPANTRGFP